MKKLAAEEANHEGERYRKLKNPMFDKIKQIDPTHIALHFAPAKSSQKGLLHQWFEQNHIKQWMHGIGLQNTLDGLEKFFQGKSDTTYWIGYDGDIPFSFLITSPEEKDAITLDLFICDLNYLGKGIAVPMIRKFWSPIFQT